MHIDILLALLKVLGVLISGMFGVLGAVFTLHNSEGGLSKKGKIFIVGSILGLVLAVVCQILESYVQREAERKAVEDTLESARRLEAIAVDLNRSLQPIDSLEVYISSFVSLEDESFQSYRLELEKGIQSYLQKNERERFGDANFTTSVSSRLSGKSTPLKIQVRKESNLAPQNFRKAPFISSVFPKCYDFDFFKNPISESEISERWGLSKGKSDLNVNYFFPNDFTIGKDLEKGKYTVSGRLTKDDAQWSDSSGEIIALPDLAGAQMIVSGCVKSERVLNAFTSEEVRKSSADTKTELEWINLRVGRRSLSISGSYFRRIESRYKVYWIYTFPTGQEELARLFGRNLKVAMPKPN